MDPLYRARILLIDDDDLSRENLIQLLRQSGFTSLHSLNGPETLIETIDSFKPDILLLDVVMPHQSGIEVTSQVRSRFPERFMPIVLISKYADSKMRIQGFEAGANEFMTRPFDIHELILRLRWLADLKYTRDELHSEQERLQLLYHISQTLNSDLDYRALLRRIVALTNELTSTASKALLVTLNEEGQFHAKILARHDEDPRSVDHIKSEVLAHGLIGWVMTHKEAARIADVLKDTRWVHLSDTDEIARSVVAVPLLYGDTCTGAIMMTSPEADAFHDNHLTLLQAIAAQAALTLQNARLYELAQTQRARAEAILNATGDPVIVTTPEHRIESLNAAALDLLDDSKDPIGSPLLDHFGLALDDLLYRSAEHQGAVSGEYSLLAPGDEEKSTYNVSVAPVEGLGFVLVWQNISAIKENERVRLASEQAETRRVMDTFTRYMSPALIERVLADSDILNRRERRQVLVLFADLRGFTRLTVEHSPHAVIALVNDIFSAMMTIVDAHEGVLFDITGDELMVAFNVPYAQPDARQRALKTALDMLRHFRSLQVHWAERGMQVGMGIGINEGSVILGHIGGSDRMTYAMIGETINIAHRFVELAKDGEILLAPSIIAEGLPENIPGIQVKELPPQILKGKDKAQAITMVRLETRDEDSENKPPEESA